MVAPSHLKSFQALDLAVRTGSLKAAAEILSITPAAAGQRIKSLEEYLGMELLVRGRLGLKPSPALGPAITHLNAAFRELDAVGEMLDLQRGQEIHVAAVSDFVELWLRPRIDNFRRTRPNMLFSINGEGDAPPRLGTVDCEISFGPVRDASETDILFRDFVVPISSPENISRIAKLRPREQLEGFPLLHLDFYKNDPAAPAWPAFIDANRFKRTAPNRGIRFQRIMPALEAVLANAGLTICGLALIAAFIDDGRVALPFPISTGAWTSHAFQARFRKGAVARPQVRRFREWLIGEAKTTEDWLAKCAGPAGTPTPVTRGHQA